MLASTIASSDYVYRTVLPWQDIFNDLKEAGCPPYKVSIITGYGWSTLQRWVYNGVEPRESAARAILILHTRYCGEEATHRRSQEAKPLL